MGFPVDCCMPAELTCRCLCMRLQHCVKQPVLAVLCGLTASVHAEISSHCCSLPHISVIQGDFFK